MEEAALDPAPVWDDLATFDGRPWRGRVDLVSGGYPCQPFSLAGARQGASDPRHLWPHVRRIVEEVEPPLVFFENVPGHVSLGLEDVVRDLESLGYRVAALLLGAADVGAPHRRERLWLMAHRTGERWDEGLRGEPEERWGPEPRDGEQDVADSERSSLRLEPGRRINIRPGETEPGDLGRDMADAHLGRCEGVGCLGLPDGVGATSGHDTDGLGGRVTGPMGDAGGAGSPRRESGPVAGALSAPGETGAEAGMGHAEREREDLRATSGGPRSAACERGVWPPGPADHEAWALVPEDSQPAICRSTDGLPPELESALAFRSDRLRALGNAVVPACAAAAFRILLGQLFHD